MKKTDIKKSEVIIVGADHHNTLGVIRALGGDYIVNLIIHQSTATKKIKCSKSWYFNGKLVVVKEDEKELLSVLSAFERNLDDRKIAVIPTSDFAALCIDKNYNELSKYYALPSIDHTEGRIAYYMDKFHQKELADKYGIRMADSIVIDLLSEKTNTVLDDITYPRVLKPVVSANGSKNDITIVSNQSELKNALELLKKKGYTQILMQQYIKKDFEICACGCIAENSKKIIFGAFKKLREYPSKCGSASLIETVEMSDLLTPILNALVQINYSGMFDFDLFIVGKKAYLNEINFRNGGNMWALIRSGINAQDIWINDMFGNPTSIELFNNSKKILYMNETDFHHVLNGEITLFKWIKDAIKANAYCYFCIKDIAGTLAWLKK